MAERAFGRDVDGVRPRAVEPPLDVARPRQRQPDFRIARQRQRPELARRQEFQFRAERARLARDMAERAHHAVDLRVPRVGGDQDFHGSHSAAGSLLSFLALGPRFRGRSCRLRLRCASARLDVVARLRPGDDLESAVVMLGHRRAAFHPVAAIDVTQAEIVVHGGGVDVAADHAVDAMMLGLGGERLLERADDN